MDADDRKLIRDDVVSIVAIMAVVFAVLRLFANRFDEAEKGTLTVVFMSLLIFEAGRYVDRFNRQMTKRRRIPPWLSIGRVRLLVVFGATTAMLILYSEKFDWDEIWIIAGLAASFGTYEGVRAAWQFLKDLDPATRLAIGDSRRIAWKAFLEGLSRALGTAAGAAVAVALGFVFRSWLAALLR